KPGPEVEHTLMETRNFAFDERVEGRDALELRALFDLLVVRVAAAELRDTHAAAGVIHLLQQLPIGRAHHVGFAAADRQHHEARSWIADDEANIPVQPFRTEIDHLLPAAVAIYHAHNNGRLGFVRKVRQLFLAERHDRATARNTAEEMKLR